MHCRQRQRHMLDGACGRISSQWRLKPFSSLLEKRHSIGFCKCYHFSIRSIRWAIPTFVETADGLCTTSSTATCFPSFLLLLKALLIPHRLIEVVFMSVGHHPGILCIKIFDRAFRFERVGSDHVEMFWDRFVFGVDFGLLGAAISL